MYSVLFYSFIVTEETVLLFSLAVPFSKSILKSQWVKGAAANIFHKNAIGKFLKRVPVQIAGSCDHGAPARIMLNRIEATMLIVGHMTATVHDCRIRR
jgi:hypothetical protein